VGAGISPGRLAVPRWVVEVVESTVKLTYFETLEFDRALAKPCGSGDIALLPEVAHFAAQQASPWDLVTMPNGEFVRLLAPTALV
jgi:hypothetical protein